MADQNTNSYKRTIVNISVLIGPSAVSTKWLHDDNDTNKNSDDKDANILQVENGKESSVRVQRYV